MGLGKFRETIYEYAINQCMSYGQLMYYWDYGSGIMGVGLWCELWELWE